MTEYNDEYWMRQALQLALRAQAASEFATYLTSVRSAESYRADILPRAEQAYTLYLARYREMGAAYPQVLVAQRGLFEMAREYLNHLEEAWRSALRLQGLLAGDIVNTAARLQSVAPAGRPRTSAQLLPRSSDVNSPPGIVPAHSRLPSDSSAQSCTSFHGVLSFESAGCGGYSGAATSSPVLPSSALRCSFTPKCPRLSAA